ncbi:MAG: hypothetical protein IPF73_07585 [Betaproteobacteria bacterium]|nr:hypothetical protein [Betaproteobacteria bacterium]
MSITSARAAGAASINAHRPAVIAASREPWNTWRQPFMTTALLEVLRTAG